MTTQAAIEVKNGLYCLRKQVEKVPNDVIWHGIRLYAPILDLGRKTKFYNIFHSNFFVSQHIDLVLAHGEAAILISLEHTHTYHLCNPVLLP